MGSPACFLKINSLKNESECVKMNGDARKSAQKSGGEALNVRSEACSGMGALCSYLGY